MDDLVEHVGRTLRAALPQGCHLLVACSGGSDSQALLDLVGRLKNTLGVSSVEAVGVNHGLRASAEGELSLAKALASRHGIAFSLLSVEVSKEGNLLENARIARYGAMRGHVSNIASSRILTGHTATDQCETMLQRLARGTSLRGAAAMAMVRDDIVRPLLGVERNRLRAYLKTRNIPFAEDPSNLDRNRTRTLAREDILPALQVMNQGAIGHVAQFAEHAGEATAYLDQLARKHLTASLGPLKCLDVQSIKNEEPFLQRWILGLWLQDHGISVRKDYLSQLESLCDTPGKNLSVAGRDIRHEHGRLWVPVPSDGLSTPFEPGRPLRVANLDGAVTLRLESAKKKQLSPFKVPQQVAFDADRLHLELKMRTWTEGDEVRPFGLQGSVKLGDLFTNQKIPRAMRTHWPVVLSGNDMIWVVGLRRGSQAPISETTTRVLYMEYSGAPFWQLPR